MSNSSGTVVLREIPAGIEFGCASFLNAGKIGPEEHRAWGRLRTDVAVWAFRSRSVSLINCVNADVNHFVLEQDQFVRFETRDGTRYAISYHENCSSDLLTMAATHDDFELNWLCIAVLGNCDRAELERLLESTSLNPNGVATSQEVMHCMGDAAGYLVRWLNPAYVHAEIISAVAGFCEKSRLRLDMKYQRA